MVKGARAISLDLDGTLYRVPPLVVAWRLRAQRGLLVALIAAREKIRHEAPVADGDALLWREAELVSASFGWTVDRTIDQLRRLRNALPEALTRRVRPYPGVKSALQAAHARGLRLAVLSDYDPGEKLEWLGLSDLPWTVQLGADQLGALKPHPRAFQRVAERLELDPSEIVHVGDREDLDIEGALAAGMRAWRFAPGRGVKSRAELVFDRWGVSLFVPLATAIDRMS